MKLRSGFCILFASLVFVFSATPLLAEEEKHKIDIWLEEAIKKDSSTAGMREATNEAREMWDKEMNETYQRLLDRSSEEQKEILKAAQKAWVAFRDANGELITEFVVKDGGTAHQLIATSMGYQMVKDRALQLKAYETPMEAP